MQLPAPLADHQYRLQQAIDQLRTTPRISVVIIWSVRFRDIFRTDLPVTRTTGWERIGNDNASCAEQVMQFGATSGVDCLEECCMAFEP